MNKQEDEEGVWLWPWSCSIPRVPLILPGGPQGPWFLGVHLPAVAATSGFSHQHGVKDKGKKLNVSEQQGGEGVGVLGWIWVPAVQKGCEWAGEDDPGAGKGWERRNYQVVVFQRCHKQN